MHKILDQYTVSEYYSRMTYDVNTLEEVIAAFDGPSSASTQFPELSPQAVCNWKAKGFIPPSRHLQAIILLKRMGKRVNPAIFDCSEDDWRLLGLLPGPPVAAE